MTNYREMIHSAGILARELGRAEFMDPALLKSLRVTLRAAHDSADAPPPAVAELTRAIATLDTAAGGTPAQIGGLIERRVKAAGRLKFFAESVAQADGTTPDAEKFTTLLNSASALLSALDRADGEAPGIVTAIRNTIAEAAALDVPTAAQRPIDHALAFMDAAGDLPGAVVFVVSGFVGQAQRAIAPTHYTAGYPV